MTKIVKPDIYKKIGKIDATDYIEEWFWAENPVVYHQLELQLQEIADVYSRPYGFEEEEVTLGLLFGRPDPDSPAFRNGLDNYNMSAPLQRIFKHLVVLLQETYPEFEGEFKRALLNRVRAGGKIREHIDTGYHAENTHRIHLCMFTNPLSHMTIDGHMFRMEIGGIYEVNNIKPHQVVNKGETSRTHLIVDWGPKNDPHWSKAVE